MFLEKLFLRNFRSFKEAAITFSPQLNFIQGDNAQGKTNLLEAIIFLSTGRSFRTHQIKELIHHGSSFFYLEAHFTKNDVPQVIKAHFDGERKLQINQTNYSSFNPLLGILPTILYAPEDVSLVSGGPMERRRFLDLHLAQVDPLYLENIARYTKAMKQRNALLRENSEDGIGIWEEIMAETSAYLIKKREEAINLLLPTFQNAGTSLSESKDQLTMQYQSTLQPTSSYLEQYQAKRPKELSYGTTLIGPHRDEMVVSLNGMPARMYSSEGQKRCILASMRFAEWQRIQSLIGSPPILSIDDFGAHLDAKRRLFLQHQLAGKGQVFLTSPFFQENAFASHQRQTFVVKEGTITCQ